MFAKLGLQKAFHFVAVVVVVVALIKAGWTALLGSHLPSSPERHRELTGCQASPESPNQAAQSKGSLGREPSISADRWALARPGTHTHKGLPVRRAN